MGTPFAKMCIMIKISQFKRQMAVYFLTTTVFASVQAANQCIDLFKSSHNFEYSLGQKAADQFEHGYVLVTSGRSKTRVTSDIRYTVKNQKTLRLDRVSEDPTYYGQHIYRNAIQLILNRNPQIDTIVISLDSRYLTVEHFNEFRQQGSSVLKKHPVLKELDAIGFGQIKLAEEMRLGTQNFISLSLGFGPG